MEVIHYFAYGSNMNETRMLHRLPMIIGSRFAILYNYELLFHSCSANPGSLKGYCTITPAKGSVVEGILYTLPLDVLNTLDRYEGVPYSYQRDDIIVQCEEEQIQAITYQAQNCSTELMPSTDYLFHVLQNPHFSDGYYQKLIETKTLEEVDDQIPLFVTSDFFSTITKAIPALLNSLNTTKKMRGGLLMYPSKSELLELDGMFREPGPSWPLFAKRKLSLEYTIEIEPNSEQLENAITKFMTRNGNNEALFACWRYVPM